MTLQVAAPPPLSEHGEQTLRSFSDKWSKNPSLAVKQTLDPDSMFQKWILERNGWATPDVLKEKSRAAGGFWTRVAATGDHDDGTH